MSYHFQWVSLQHSIALPGHHKAFGKKDLIENQLRLLLF